MAYSLLGQGFLTGKYQRGAPPPGARTTLFERGTRYDKPGIEGAVDAYLALAAEHGIDPVHFALAFVTSRLFVTSNIIGATTMKQLDACLSSVDVAFTPEIEAAIDAVRQVHQNPAR